MKIRYIARISNASKPIKIKIQDNIGTMKMQFETQYNVTANSDGGRPPF